LERPGSLLGNLALNRSRTANLARKTQVGTVTLSYFGFDRV
jgi:hypothetical protein